MSHPDNTPTPGKRPEEKRFYILRGGEILGPFSPSALMDLVKIGRAEFDDFAQEIGDSEWSPLRWVLDPANSEALEGAHAPTWQTLIKWAWLRLRYNLEERSLSSGWIFLGIALAGLFLSRWPALLWAPWAALAFFGGIALYRRERAVAGISLMLTSAIVPAALWAYFWKSAG